MCTFTQAGIGGSVVESIFELQILVFRLVRGLGEDHPILGATLSTISY